MNCRLPVLSLVFLLFGPASPLIAAMLVLTFLAMVQLISGITWLPLSSKKTEGLRVSHTKPAASYRSTNNVDTVDLKKQIAALRQSAQPSTADYLTQLGDQ